MSNGPHGRPDTPFELLLAGVVSGDASAGSELFARFQPALIRYLRAREPRVADDLAADVWVAVAGSVGSFEGNEQQFRAWIFTIARRQVAGHRRTGIRRRTDVVDTSALEQIPSRDDPARQVIDASSSQDAIARMMRHISEDQAEVLLLRVVAELDVAEVALIVGRSENWVRVTQHRALRRLAERLGQKEL